MMKNLEDSLVNILQYAKKNVKYYSKLYRDYDLDKFKIEDISSFKTISKETIQKYPQDFLSEEYKKYPKQNNLELKRTSGSTGQCLQVYWDYKDDIRSLYPLWSFRMHKHNIDPTMKFCGFNSSIYQNNKIIEPKDFVISNNGRCLSFSKYNLNTKRLLQIYNKILDFNPYWFSMQPSMVYLLADLVINFHLPRPSHLKYIELNGETLFPFHENIIQKAFNITPTNMYGLTEVNTVAVSCSYKHLHLLDANVYIEVLKDGVPTINKEGDIYVTSLTNHAMPLIRYQTGDKGLLKEIKCPCGRTGKILELHAGRTADLIILENGQKISSYIFLGIIEYTNAYMSNAIAQFQIKQIAINAFDVILSLKDNYKNWESAVLDAFLNNIKEPLLKNAKWEFHFVDRIYPDSKTGKLKYFIPLSKERSL